MDESRKSLFSHKMGRRFIDVYEARSGKPYLVLTESSNINGTWTKQRLTVFQDDLVEWEKALQEAIRFMSLPVQS